MYQNDGSKTYKRKSTQENMWVKNIWFLVKRNLIWQNWLISCYRRIETVKRSKTSHNEPHESKYQSQSVTLSKIETHNSNEM